MVYEIGPIKYKFKLNVKGVKAFKVWFKFIIKELRALVLCVNAFRYQFSLWVKLLKPLSFD